MEETPQYMGPQSRPIGHGMRWISSAFKLFKQDASMWIVTIIVAFIILLLMGAIPFLGSLASMALTYVWMGGLMLGCHAAYSGKSFDVKYLFAGFSNNLLKLVQLSIIMSMLSMVIFALVIGPSNLEMILTLEQMAPAEQTQLVQVVSLKVLIALALLLPLTMAAWFAPVLIVIHNMSLLDAIKASASACVQNVMPFLLYGIVMLMFYIAALIPFMLGLLVFAPLIITSIYTSYRDIFLAESDAGVMQMEA